MRQTWLTVVVAASGLLASTGCGLSTATSLAGHAFKEVRGARGEYLPVRDIPPAVLARARSVTFTPATAELGPRIVPPSVLGAYDRAASQEASRLASKYPGGEPALVVDSDLLYFQPKGLTSGALLLASIRLHLGDEPVGAGLVKVESDSTLAGGEDPLARAALAALGRVVRGADRELE